MSFKAMRINASYATDRLAVSVVPGEAGLD